MATKRNRKRTKTKYFPHAYTHDRKGKRKHGSHSAYKKRGR